MSSDPALDLAALLDQVRTMDLPGLEGVGASRIAELRTKGPSLEAARVRAMRAADEFAVGEAQDEVHRLAISALSGPAWASDAITYAHTDFLIGPALEALRDAVLAALAGDAVDSSTRDALAGAWREGSADRRPVYRTRGS
jgi:hypothetical protein